MIEVCAAVTFHKGRLLLATRRPGGSLAGFWEFPGGKCESGESLEKCIARELEEELALHVKAECELLVLKHEYPEKIVNLHFMLCTLADGQQAMPQEGQTASWFKADELGTLTFAPADKSFIDKMKRMEEAGDDDIGIVSPDQVEKLEEWFING